MIFYKNTLKIIFKNIFNYPKNKIKIKRIF